MSHLSFEELKEMGRQLVAIGLRLCEPDPEPEPEPEPTPDPEPDPQPQPDPTPDPKPDPDKPKVPSFSAKHLAKILPNLQNPEEEFPAVEAALLEFDMTTFDRVAQFFGQVASETGGGQWFQELDNASGTYLKAKPYYPYYGRGAIHLTWKENYQKAADYFDAPELVKTPSVASWRKWRWRTACWFWSVYADINPSADHANFDECMKRVLGTSVHPSRQTRWQNYINACQNLPIPFAIKGQYRTRGDRALAYILPGREKISYKWWTSGALVEGPPPWSKNAPPPPIEKVREGFCAAIPTLMLRKVGKRVPFRTNLPQGVDPTEWDGGIAAYFGGVFGGAYYGNYMHPYDRSRDYPHLTLVGSPFYGSSSQGHVGIILGNGRLLDLNSVNNFQSRFFHGAINHHFTIFVWPEDWINYSGDEF